MAAATVASTSRPHVAGDFKVLFVAFTAIANTNTYVVPGGSGVNVLGAFVVQSSTSDVVTFSVSGQTLTANVSANTPDVTVAILYGSA